MTRYSFAAKVLLGGNPLAANAKAMHGMFIDVTAYIRNLLPHVSFFQLSSDAQQRAATWQQQQQQQCALIWQVACSA
jgi:hypothetical protein